MHPLSLKLHDYEMEIIDVASKALSEDWEDPRPIKEEDDTDMGATCVQSFVMGILGRDTEDSMKNQNIGNKN